MNADTVDNGYDPYNSAARWTWFDYATTNGGRYRRWMKVAPRYQPPDDIWRAMTGDAPPLHGEPPPTTLPP